MLKRIAEEYKKRWGIETGYRCIEQMRPCASKSASVRIMLFCMAVIMHNMWMREGERTAQDSELALDMPIPCMVMLVCALEEMPWAHDPGG